MNRANTKHERQTRLFNNITEELENLKTQNTELLEMLKTCKSCFSDPWFTQSRAENMLIAIQKMIDKAEGR